MDADKRRRIASEGGKAAHQSGRAHQWTSVEAREAGRKGGKATHAGRAESIGDPISDSASFPGDKANENE